MSENEKMPTDAGTPVETEIAADEQTPDAGGQATTKGAAATASATPAATESSAAEQRGEVIIQPGIMVRDHLHIGRPALDIARIIQQKPHGMQSGFIGHHRLIKVAGEALVRQRCEIPQGGGVGGGIDKYGVLRIIVNGRGDVKRRRHIVFHALVNRTYSKCGLGWCRKICAHRLLQPV